MLKASIDSWTALMVHNQSNNYESDLLWAQLSPVRCSFQNQSNVITKCNDDSKSYCRTWKATENATNAAFIGEVLGLRFADLKNVTISGMGGPTGTEYSSQAVFNVSVSASHA